MHQLQNFIDLGFDFHNMHPGYEAGFIALQPHPILAAPLFNASRSNALAMKIMYDHVNCVVHACNTMQYQFFYLAAWTHKSTHVFHQSNHGQVQLATEVDFFPDGCQGNLLWGGDNDGPLRSGVGQRLHH